MTPRRLPRSALLALPLFALASCRSAAPMRSPTETAGADAARKCVILLPLAYNDGSPVPMAVLTDIQDQLYAQFGGFTVAGRVTGAYRMADGTRASDESLEIWVAVPAERIRALRRQVATFARQLRQESLYFEVSATTVEFVAAAGP